MSMDCRSGVSCKNSCPVPAALSLGVAPPDALPLGVIPAALSLGVICLSECVAWCVPWRVGLCRVFSRLASGLAPPSRGDKAFGLTLTLRCLAGTPRRAKVASEVLFSHWVQGASARDQATYKRGSVAVIGAEEARGRRDGIDPRGVQEKGDKGMFTRHTRARARARAPPRAHTGTHTFASCASSDCDSTQRITCWGVPRNEQRRRPSDPLLLDALS